MPDLEQLTITLPTTLAADLRGAVEAGAYASSNEAVLEALRDWQLRRTSQADELAALRAEIARGLADVAAGRVEDFSTDRIVAQGRRQSADRSPSA